MPERIGQLLGDSLVHAIDAYFDARSRLITALVTGDQAAAQQANEDSRRALSDWLALLVERLDSRAAGILVDVLKRIENVEVLMGVSRRPLAPPPDGDDGHDTTGSPI